MANLTGLKQMIYAERYGQLYWHKFVGGADGRKLWAPGFGTLVGEGFNVYKPLFVFSGGFGGIIYGIKPNGELYCTALVSPRRVPRLDGSATRDEAGRHIWNWMFRAETSRVRRAPGEKVRCCRRQGGYRGATPATVSALEASAAAAPRAGATV